MMRCPMLCCSLPILLAALLLLSSCCPACWAPPGPDRMRRIEVMSFNIRYDNAGDGDNRWERRIDLVVETIARYDPDIIGVQEALAHQLDVLLERLPQYRSIGVGRDDGKRKGEFSAILYRAERFEPIAQGTFWLSDTPDTPGSTSWGNDIPRICTWGRFRTIDSGDTTLIYNTHFDHRSQSSRERSAAAILDHIADQRTTSIEPVILMGDFNAGESNPAITAILASDLDLRMAFRAVHPDDDEPGTFHGFDGRPTSAKIDHIFVTPGLFVRNAEVIRHHDEDRYPSDHFPVRATLDPS
jgi:endonuclease/exonuclease/phosphatase family metal-dependent hydrolase